MNNNLRTIKLGAPTSIEGGASPNASISVQTMERCDTLTLHDGADGTRCTDEGAMVTAARLLSQLMHERSISENAEGWSITYDWRAMADAAKYGGAEHPVQMSLTGADGAAVCWAVEGDATPGVSLTADGVLTLPAGCTDTLRIKAIKWDDREVRTTTTIHVSYWREVADSLAEISELLEQYPSLAAVLAEYPSLAAVLAERPALGAVVAEWPSVVNSLVETGKRNFIKGDGVAYIDTDYNANNNTKLTVVGRFQNNTQSGTWPAIVGACDSGEARRFTIMRHGGNNVFMGVVYSTSHSENMLGDTLTHEFYLSNTEFKVDNKVVLFNETAVFTTSNKLSMFRDNNASNPSARIAPCDISYCHIMDNHEEHMFIPFVRNGTVGMLDLNAVDFASDSAFLARTNASGTLTIVTENV